MSTIGRYQLIEVAGRGNMGVVYRAYDPNEKREVAVKVCTTTRLESDTERRLYRRLFLNEAHTAGSLSHPGILAVYDAGEDEDQPYIVMEYVSGGQTLDQHCDRQRLLPIRRVLEIGFHCAKALDYAHRRGVIHRDIKPSNVMVQTGGGIKIGDFGIAQQEHSEATQVLGAIGSPKYMSPEQAREDELTNQTDLYSLGVVLFELLTGRSPYPVVSLTGLLYCILNDTPANVHDLRPEVPVAVSEIVAKCLAKDLSKRYAMGAEIAADITAIANIPDADVVDDSEKFLAVRELHFFNEFSDAEIWEVIRACEWTRNPARSRIITEGLLDQSFYVLVSGSVSVHKGVERITTLRAGDCFGEMAYLSKAERTASIVAQEDVLLLKISATLIERASVGCQLRFNREFIRTLIERLTRTSRALAER